MKAFFFMFIVLLGCEGGESKKDKWAEEDVSRDLREPDLGIDVNMTERDQGIDIQSDSSSDSYSLDNLVECTYKTSASTFESKETLIIIGEDDQKELGFTLALCEYAAGRGESSLYRPDYFEVRYKGVKYPVALKDIVYENTHHSWFDELNSDNGRERFKWSAIYDPQRPEDVEFVHRISGKIGDEVVEERVMRVRCDLCRDFQFISKR